MFLLKVIEFYKRYGKSIDKKTLMFYGFVVLWKRLFGGSYDKYYSYVLNKLSEQFKDVIDKYRYDDTITENNSKDIWMFWFQGKENLPPVVRRCYKLACDNFSDYNIHFITRDNCMNYVDMPNIILDNVDNELISKTHFSDILRVKLLRKYGGFWMDATLFSASNNQLPKDSFSTIKLPSWGGLCL